MGLFSQDLLPLGAEAPGFDPNEKQSAAEAAE
jgi:hypothetical protein